MENIFEQYNENIFIPEQEKWLQHLKQRLDEQNDELSQQFGSELAAALEAVPSVQTAALSLSLLCTSIVEKKPMLLIEVFDEVSDSCLFSQKIAVPWLFEEWQEYQHQLSERAIPVRRIVKEPHIESLCWQSVQMMIFLTGVYLRYWFIDGVKKKLAILDRMAVFSVFFGAYGGDCELIYCEMPTIKLSEAADTKEGAYCHFSGESCKNREFINTNFRQTVFENCRFEKCIFNDCDMRDVKLISCRFFECIFKDCKIDGACFDTDYFYITDLSGLIAGNDDQEIFRQAQGHGCQFSSLLPPVENAVVWINSSFQEA